MKKVPLFRSVIGEEEIAAVTKVLRSGWVTLGPRTAEFEEKYAAYIGTKYAVATNSCTAALHLALNVFDFPKGSEVLLATINFISAPHAVRYNNLKPVFVDVDPNTLCIDVLDLEKKITPKSKAIIVTHLGGTSVAMEKVKSIAKKHNLKIIEDVANAVGGSYKGKALGSIGHIGCHSFEGKKNMITGDGGMITLNDKKLYEKLKRLRWLGINKDTWKRFSEKQGNYSWYYEVAELGFKYNMNDITAAIGLAQLKKLPRIKKEKQALVRRYDAALKDVSWLKTPTHTKGADQCNWLYIVQVPNRDAFMTYMQQHGITTGVHFMPMHLHSLYKKNAKTPVADRVWRDIVSLPLFVGMTREDQGYVIKTIKNFNHSKYEEKK